MYDKIIFDFIYLGRGDSRGGGGGRGGGGFRGRGGGGRGGGGGGRFNREPEGPPDSVVGKISVLINFPTLQNFCSIYRNWIVSTSV